MRTFSSPLKTFAQSRHAIFHHSQRVKIGFRPHFSFLPFSRHSSSGFIHVWRTVVEYMNSISYRWERPPLTLCTLLLFLHSFIQNRNLARNNLSSFWVTHNSPSLFDLVRRAWVPVRMTGETGLVSNRTASSDIVHCSYRKFGETGRPLTGSPLCIYECCSHGLAVL